jgi:hypothetical protein
MQSIWSSNATLKTAAAIICAGTLIVAGKAIADGT